jgi:hypothetical protein
MPWQVSKYIFLLLARLKRSVIYCQGVLAQIQSKMTLSLSKTIGHCFLSGLSVSKQRKTSPRDQFILSQEICHNRQNKDQIKMRRNLNPQVGAKLSICD